MSGPRSSKPAAWPVTAAEFVLETTPALGPASAWTPVAMPVAILGDQFTVSNTTATGTSFFRLRR